MASNIHLLTPSRNLLFTTKIFPAAFTTSDKVSNICKTKALEGVGVQLIQARHRQEGYHTKWKEDHFEEVVEASFLLSPQSLLHLFY